VRAKILVVDDEAAICRLFAEMLRLYGGYDVVTETDPRQVLPLLHEQAFDIVLLDIMMPGINGIDLLRQIKHTFDHIPVLIVTSYGSTTLAVESMLAGAADFVTKPVEGMVLNVRVQKALENAQSRHLASVDTLTGLYNHQTFHLRLEQEVERANRYHRLLTLLMIEIDHFQHYSTTHGHVRVDAALVDFAVILWESSRTTDIIARYGSAEFVVLLPETTEAQAVSIAYRLRERVEQHKFPGEETLPVKLLTVSIGIATHVPFFGTRDALVAAAESALLAAQQSGGNCLRVSPYEADC
jgi:diguanylate cyclase (GGDEF)-like protein